MKLEDLTPELAKQAAGCTTPEERMTFVRDNGIELTDEQLEAISGGMLPTGSSVQICPKGGQHDLRKTGNERPGDFFGSLWPDVEYRCIKCGESKWLNW